MSTPRAKKVSLKNKMYADYGGWMSKLPQKVEIPENMPERKVVYQLKNKPIKL